MPVGMELFTILVMAGLQVGVVVAIVVGTVKFLTGTAAGRRLSERLWGGSRAVTDELVEEVRALRADVEDLQERCEVTERIVARLAHAQPSKQIGGSAE